MRLVYLLLLSLMMSSKASGQTRYVSAVIDKIGRMGGNGGIIALDSNMYRGASTESSEIEIAIYK